MFSNCLPKAVRFSIYATLLVALFSWEFWSGIPPIVALTHTFCAGALCSCIDILEFSENGADTAANRLFAALFVLAGVTTTGAALFAGVGRDLWFDPGALSKGLMSVIAICTISAATLELCEGGGAKGPAAQIQWVSWGPRAP